jgi:nucleoside-diphosphate-sugar epimerase
MAPKIFLYDLPILLHTITNQNHSTGGTGYIGGSVLHTLATTHSEYEITVLLRKTPEAFQSTYPNITIIQGDYDSVDTISSAAEAAEIVVHNGDSDHEPSLNAIIAGQLKRSTPGYLLHLSGTGIVSDWNDEQYLGKLNPKVWSDVSSLEEIRSLPPTALHRNTETILHETVTQHGGKINIAIICPPDIYGLGKGLVKKHSALLPMYITEIRNLGGKAFHHGDGSNTRSWVHIDDLMRLYLHVVEAAASATNLSKYFNKNGYYFASTQEHSHIDIARATASILHAHGIIGDKEPKEVGLDTLDSMANIPGFPKLARYLFASNSRSRAERAGQLFGYKGQAPGLLETLESDIVAAVKGA